MFEESESPQRVMAVIISSGSMCSSCSSQGIFVSMPWKNWSWLVFLLS